MDCSIEEVITTGLLLLFLTHFYIPVLEPVQSSLFTASSDDQTMMGQCVNFGIWAAAGALMLRRCRGLFSGLNALWWPVVLSLFALVSALWSQDSSITLRKSVFLLLTTVFGMFFARCFTIERQMRMICVAGLVAALLSIAFALFLPAYGLDHDVHQGVWIGIFTQKNVCAREMLFLLATVLPLQPATSLGRLVRRIVIVAMLVVILGTQSKTALLILAVMSLVFPAVLIVRRVSRGFTLVIGLSGLAIAGTSFSLAASAMPQLIALIGRDGTMSGRTEIWKAVLQAIMKHPLLGYGFAAFWLSLRGESANIILALRWAVPAAHNGFLDIWLQLGAVGLALFLAGFVLALCAACGKLRQPSYSRAAWPVAVLVLTLVYNLDESSLMQPNDFLWVIYVATLVNVAVPCVDRQCESQSATQRDPAFAALIGQR